MWAKRRICAARVRQYARGGDGRVQIRFLLAQLADVEVLMTSSEKEALLLENTLIKQHWPRYNIRLKDDKSYWHVKVTTHEPWPRIFLTRQILKDGSKYLGPFHSSTAVQETVELIRKVFPLRTCSDTVFRNRTRPCLEYQMHRCLGPCTLPVDPEEYRRHLKNALLLLEGKNTELVTQLTTRMQAAAEALHFEEAAKLRDQLRAITQTGEKQQVATPLGYDQDIFGLYREGGSIEMQVLFVRAGKLVGGQSYSFEDHEFPDEEVVSELLTQFYQGERFIPDELIVPLSLEDASVREELLSERKGKKVSVLYPQRGDKVRLVEWPTRTHGTVSLRNVAARNKKRKPWRPCVAPCICAMPPSGSSVLTFPISRATSRSGPWWSLTKGNRTKTAIVGFALRPSRARMTSP